MKSCNRGKQIVLFPSAFHPSLGGVEELTGQLALQLKASGMGVLICTNRWPRDLPRFENWKGIPVRRYPFRLPEHGIKSRVSFFFTKKLILRTLFDDLRAFGASLVHVQCVSSNAWYASSAAREMNVPLIVSTQGERTMDAIQIYERHPLYNRLMIDVIGKARFVTACSQSAMRDLDSFCSLSQGPSSQRVIYNGVGSEVFEDAPVWPHPRPFLFAMGRMVAQKGFRELLHAFALADLKGTDLLLAGDGQDKCSLIGLTEELGLSKRVRFVGKADRRMVAELLSGAVGLVVPSLREPMGIVALEGMAAGKPLLVSAVGGLKEIAPEGPWCRHHSPGNIQELKKGLEWLGRIDLTKALESHRTYARDFLWNRVAEQYINLYSQCN